MNYELEKELKDAGFPQKGEGMFDCPHPDYECLIDDVCSEEVYEPTLDELIEACNYMFQCLSRKNGHGWCAYSTQEINAWGTTPEEAMGRLWLALNKK